MALLIPQDPCFHTEFYFCVNFIQILGGYANASSRRDPHHPYVCALLNKLERSGLQSLAQLPRMRKVGGMGWCGVGCKAWARLPKMRTVGGLRAETQGLDIL